MAWLKGIDLEKLPIWGTVKGSLGFCFSNFNNFVKAGSAPFILYILIMLVDKNILAMYSPLESTKADGTLYIVGVIGLGIVSFLVSIPFATAWHRHYLNGGAANIKWFQMPFKAKERKYILMTLLLSLLLILVVGIPLIGIAQFKNEVVVLCLFGIVIFLTVFIGIRTVMVYPAAAIGASAGIKDSWRATKGSVLRMFFTYLLLVLILGLPMGLLSAIIAGVMFVFMQAGSPIFENFEGIFQVLLMPFQLFVTAAGVTCLSIVYKFLSTRDDHTDVVTDQYGVGSNL